jgi:hypothetical protein
MSKNGTVNHDANGGGTLAIPVILAAASGNTDALCVVVNHYKGYINALSTMRLYDECGNTYFVMDEDLRQELEMRLITKAMKFKPRTV